MPRRQHPPQVGLDVVQQIAQGEKSAAQICREHALSHSLISRPQAAYERYEPGVFSQQPSELLSLERRVAELERLLGQAHASSAFLKNASAAHRKKLGGR